MIPYLFAISSPSFTMACLYCYFESKTCKISKNNKNLERNNKKYVVLVLGLLGGVRAVTKRYERSMAGTLRMYLQSL